MQIEKDYILRLIYEIIRTLLHVLFQIDIARQNGPAFKDEQRMEWQANSLAPRILMPLATFKMKVAEVYSKYRITEEKDTQNPLLMDLVAEELAAFYAVSKQSVLIRMQEIGFTEAKAISPFESLKNNSQKL